MEKIENEIPFTRALMDVEGSELFEASQDDPKYCFDLHRARFMYTRRFYKVN